MYKGIDIKFLHSLYHIAARMNETLTCKRFQRLTKSKKKGGEEGKKTYVRVKV